MNMRSIVPILAALALTGCPLGGSGGAAPTPVATTTPAPVPAPCSTSSGTP